MPERDENGDGPDFTEAVKGAANMYDLAQQMFHGNDPKMRESANNLDEVTVGEALDQFSDVVSAPKVDESSVDVPNEPKVEVMEGESGIDIVVDTAGTDVKPADVVVEKPEDDTIAFREGSEGWENKIQIEKAFLPINDIDVSINGQMMTAEVDLEEPAENNEVAESEDGSETEMITISKSDTVNELVNEHPEIEEQLSDAGLPISMVQMMYGDSTVEELSEETGVDIQDAVEMADVDIEVEIVD